MGEKTIIKIGGMTGTLCAQTIAKALAQRPVLCALSNNPGRAMVFYDEGTVVGGGAIKQVGK